LQRLIDSSSADDDDAAMGPLSFAAIVKAITVRVLERGMTKWV
jgi:hypothetical protein